MKISKAFQELIKQFERVWDGVSAGSGWKKIEEIGEKLIVGNWACRFIKAGPQRGKLVFVWSSSSNRWGRSVNREEIKEKAISLLLRKLHRSGKRRIELRAEQMSEILDLHTAISERLLAEKIQHFREEQTFRHTRRALANRRFDPETLEFDLTPINKYDPGKNPAIAELKKQLDTCRLRPSERDQDLREAVGEIDLSTRVYYLLRALDIRTVQELRSTKDILYRVKGVGPKSRKEIEDVLTRG